MRNDAVRQRMLRSQKEQQPTKFTIDDAVECVMQLLLDGKISDKKAQSLLTHYDQLKKQGHYYI